jgi:predicted DCC family thiol-disulfide oxidoreductase YuxK
MDPPAEIVVFDGICNLCTHAVAFILAHERDHSIRFAAAQSPAGRELLLRSGLDPQTLTTFVFIKGGTLYSRSDAAIEVAYHLRLPWRMFRVLRLVPRRFRDALYGFVARNRYRWFGRRESCRVPSPELSFRFVDGGKAGDSDGRNALTLPGAQGPPR